MGSELKTDLSIDLRTLNKDLASLYILDTTQDGRLEEEDLIPLYGRTTAHQSAARLASAVHSQDPMKIQATLRDMMAKSRALSAQFLAERVPPEKIKALGGSINATGEMDFSGVSGSQLIDLGRLFLTAAYEINKKEFGGLLMAPSTDPDVLLSVGKAIKDLPRSGFVEQSGFAVSYLGLAVYLSPRADGVLDAKQLLYFVEEGRENSQPEPVSHLERKFDIDIRTSSAIRPSTWILLDAALSELRQLTGDKLPEMQKLSILGQNGYHLDILGFHGEADYRTRHVSIRESLVQGTFKSRRSRADAPVYGHMQEIAQLPEFSFIKYTLAHELGHFLFEESSIAESYKKWFGDVAEGTTYHLSHETFAEDYAVYILSHGQKVMKHRHNGDLVPHYQERLALFRKHIEVVSPQPAQAPGVMALEAVF